jgi:hypothetical protein
MSTAVESPQVSGERASPSLSALSVALDGMERAARTAGIDPDEALGLWIRTLRIAMECNATVVQENAREMHATIAGIKEVTAADHKRLQAAIAASEAQTRKIEASVSSIDVRAHNLLTQTIDRMAAEVAGKMRERMVIVEERHNRFVLWRTGAFIAAVLLAAIGGGYVWRAYSDQTATTLLERCTASPFQDPSTGQLYCQFGPTQALR